jgi:hypothetical protein
MWPPKSSLDGGYHFTHVRVTVVVLMAVNLCPEALQPKLFALAIPLEPNLEARQGLETRSLRSLVTRNHISRISHNLYLSSLREDGSVPR